MTNSLRYLGLAVLCTLWAVPTGAQTASTSTTAVVAQQSPPTEPSETPTRRATPTFLGDTGLWFVPTGEVLGHGQWSVSGYRRGTNYIQGFSNVSDVAATFAVGLGNRAEIFGSFLVDTRIDRDLRPLFTGSQEVGGIIDRYPHVSQGWTGDNLGDLYLGAKINVWSEFRQNPAALALRLTVKAPTGDDAVGVSTGKADFLFDFIGSKEIRERIEVSGYAGYEVRGEPRSFQIPGGAYRWGAGAGFPSRSPLRATLELAGSRATGDTSTTASGLDWNRSSMFSVHATEAGTHAARFRATSRLKMCESWMRSASSARSARILATELPTVPKPSSATRSGFVFILRFSKASIGFKTKA